MKRSPLLVIHRVSGLIAGLFILLLSVSGSLLVFSDEFRMLEAPPLVLRAQAPLIGVDSCFRRVRQAFPRSAILSAELTHSPQQAYVFSIADSLNPDHWQRRTVYLHPQNGTIQLVKAADQGWLYQLKRLHSSFFLGKKGEWWLGVCGLFFLLNLLTGLVIYRRSLVAALLLRRHLSNRKNLHQLVGVYALLFNLLIAFSGTWMQRYVFTASFYQASAYRPAYHSSAPLFFSPDSALREMKKTYPEFTAQVIYFASRKTGSTAVYGSRSGNGFIQSKKLADAVFLDSLGGPARTAFLENLDAGTRFDITNSQLHSGQYGGWILKCIYSLLGLTGGLLSVTGFFMWKRSRSNGP